MVGAKASNDGMGAGVDAKSAKKSMVADAAGAATGMTGEEKSNKSWVIVGVVVVVVCVVVGGADTGSGRGTGFNLAIWECLGAAGGGTTAVIGVATATVTDPSSSP